MTRRVLRVLVEVEGTAFDPDAANPYADTQAELEAVFESNLQTITSMDAGDVVTLRDTNGNRCGKVEMEDFPGDEPLLPYWTRLSDYALEVEEEFPVSKFLKEAELPLEVNEVEGTESRPNAVATPESHKGNHAAQAFDEGKFADPYPGRPGSHEHVAEPDPDDPVIASRPRRRSGEQHGASSVPAPPGDPRMK